MCVSIKNRSVVFRNQNIQFTYVANHFSQRALSIISFRSHRCEHYWCHCHGDQYHLHDAILGCLFLLFSVYCKCVWFPISYSLPVCETEPIVALCIVTRTRTHARTHAHTHAHTHTHTLPLILACPYVCSHTHTCAPTRTTHTRTHN